MNFIMVNNLDNSIKKNKESKSMFLAVIFWLIVWELLARFIGHDILLVSPVSVLFRLGELAFTGEFWNSIFFSFLRIIGGFVLALAAGMIFAVISSVSRIFCVLMEPPIEVIKATPVASFIILLLIWVSSKNLSAVTAFLMVLPVVYANILAGIRSTDRGLLEMAQVFRVSPWKKFRYIYVSQVMPFFETACSLSLGLCWKAGIAAEVIGIPSGSMGEKLYEAKVYLQTADLFVWTLTIILISVCFEKVFLWIVDILCARVSGIRKRV